MTDLKMSAIVLLEPMLTAASLRHGHLSLLLNLGLVPQVKKADQALQKENSLTQKLKQEMTSQQSSAQRQVHSRVL